MMVKGRRIRDIGKRLALLAILLSGLMAQATEFFPFCIDWHDAKRRTFEQQAEMLKVLGFDGVGHLWLDRVDERLKSLDAAGLKLFQISMQVDLSPGKPPYELQKFKHVLDLVKGRRVQFCLLINGGKASDPARDAYAVEIIRNMSDLARDSGSQLLLYPHANFWLERVEDAVRVAGKVDRPNVGVMFNLCHWLRVSHDRDYKPLLEQAMPRLWAVSINGADEHDAKPGFSRYIQPLDAGNFDIATFLKTLGELGYKGPVGLQCYGIGGDARDHLARSMAAWRKLTQGVGLLPAGRALEAWQPVKGWLEAGSVTLDPKDEAKFVAVPGTSVIVSAGKAGYLVTKESWGDVAVHVEFIIPKHSNSGVYVMGSYEVQVYDSYGVAKDHYPGIECGGIYPEWIQGANVRGHSPLVNAALPPGQWQTYDIEFRAPRFDATGKKTANARFIKVTHNGKLVQQNVEVFGPTRGGFPEKVSGPLRLQGDHGPVAYRNISIRPLPGA